MRFLPLPPTGVFISCPGGATTAYQAAYAGAYDPAAAALQAATAQAALVSEGVRVRKIGKIRKILQIFGGLALGCIKTKFCKKICV